LEGDKGKRLKKCIETCRKLVAVEFFRECVEECMGES